MTDSEIHEAGPADSTDHSWSDTSFRVRYAETDQMGVVYHSNHIIWFEVGRVEFLRRRGCTYKQMEADGYVLVVGELRVRYHAPARYDDQVTIRTRVQSARSRIIIFEYEIVNEDGARLATGETMHVVTGLDGKPRPLPDSYLKLLTEKGA